MPNYGLVINSSYDPMSFAEYAAPFEKYAEVYNRMADAYDELEMNAGQWEKLAKQQGSEQAYATFQSYANQLRAAANDLAENGLSIKTRGVVSQMRKDYFNKIKPISDAWDYKVKLAEEQRKANPKGDLQYDVDFSTIGLDKIIENPSLSYSPGRSLSEMETAGYNIAKAASSRKILSESAQDMANQYYRIMQGYDGGDVQAFVSNNIDNPAYQELMDLYEQIRTSYGTNALESIYSDEQNGIADERILLGMLKGLEYGEEYQVNYKEKLTTPSKGNQYSTQYVGFETTIKDASGNSESYTTINNGGNIAYYDRKGRKVTDNKILEKLNKEKPVGKYYLEAHNTNADIVRVMDRESGLPVVQNGKYMEFNRKTHYLDVKTFEIKPIVNPKTKTTKIPSGVVVVSNTKGKNVKDVEVDWDDFTQDDIDELLKDPTKGITYDNLEQDEKDKLPEEIKANPTSYMYYRATIDAKKGPRYGDNKVLFYKYVGQINDNNEDVSSGFDSDGIT